MSNIEQVLYPVVCYYPTESCLFLIFSKGSYPTRVCASCGLLILHAFMPHSTTSSLASSVRQCSMYENMKLLNFCKTIPISENVTWHCFNKSVFFFYHNIFFYHIYCSFIYIYHTRLAIFNGVPLLDASCACATLDLVIYITFYWVVFVWVYISVCMS